MRTRIVKELRTFTLPAGFVVAGSLLVLLVSSTSTVAHLAALLAATLFFVSAPLLGASAFGVEFHHRALSLLLAQPITRTRIWVEKCAAMFVVAAVLGAWQIFLLATVGARQIPPSAAALYWIAAVCAGPVWTLLARSTVGGAAFTTASLLIVELAGGFMIHRLGGHELKEVLIGISPALATLRIGYASFAMLGAWFVFTRLQVSSQMAGDVSSPMPGVPLMRNVLRCRRGGVIRNLIRKELRLQAPVVMVAAAFAVCWLLAVAVFALGPPRPTVADLTFTILLSVYLPLALVIASTVSIGEDTALGIHSWHLTLPVRPAVHWLVKLTSTSMAATLAVVVVPLALHAVASTSLGPAVGVPELPRRLFTPLAAFGCTLVLCFWCAALFGGPIRAAVAALVIGGVTAAVGILVMELTGRWAPAEPIFTWIMVQQQLPPEALIRRLWGMNPWRLPDVLALASLALLCLTILAMSLRAFRQGRVERRLIVRQVAALVLAVLVTFGTASAVLSSVYAAAMDSVPVRELEAAVLADAPPAMVTEPVVVPVERIAARLSPSTLRWLRGAEIRVEPLRRQSTVGGRRRPALIVATVRFPNGRHFRSLYGWRDFPPR